MLGKVCPDEPQLRGTAGVSIGIIAWNEEKAIGGMLNSLFEQSLFTELRRLPYAWWPNYATKKLRCALHWRVGDILLLSHPGCLLSYHHTTSTMIAGIVHNLNTCQLTVLVTHWWEYFRQNQTDEPFIGFLHETAVFLASNPDLRVISFAELAEGRIPLS
jgi:hypothetical protein